MLLLAHVGYSLLGLALLRRATPNGHLNSWGLAAASMFPDVVDRALYAFVLPGARSGRLIAHTLAFNLALLGALRALRGDLWPYGAACVLHVLLDAEGLSARHLLWPSLGSSLHHVDITDSCGEEGGSRPDVAGRLARVPDPYRGADRTAILHEIGGLAALGAFLLSRRWSRAAVARPQGEESEHEL